MTNINPEEKLPSGLEFLKRQREGGDLSPWQEDEETGVEIFKKPTFTNLLYTDTPWPVAAFANQNQESNVDILVQNRMQKSYNEGAVLFALDCETKSYRLEQMGYKGDHRNDLNHLRAMSNYRSIAFNHLEQARQFIDPNWIVRFGSYTPNWYWRPGREHLLEHEVYVVGTNPLCDFLSLGCYLLNDDVPVDNRCRVYRARIEEMRAACIKFGLEINIYAYVTVKYKRHSQGLIHHTYEDMSKLLTCVEGADGIILSDFTRNDPGAKFDPTFPWNHALCVSNFEGQGHC